MLRSLAMTLALGVIFGTPLGVRAQDEAVLEPLPLPDAPPEATLDTIVVDPEPIGPPYRAFSPGDAPVAVPPGNWLSPLRPAIPPGGFRGTPGGYPGCGYPGEDCPWTCQVVPDGLIYRSYLAGPREPRLAAIFDYDISQSRWVMNGTAGGRVGLFRYGDENPLRPQGFQIDAEAAAFPRIDYDTTSWDLETTDFRWGIPLTFGRVPWEFKLAYYHLSAHLGDEYIINNINNFSRINYSRDAILLGAAYRLVEPLRLYGEVGYAFATDGGAKPWEFQFGAEYSRLEPTGLRGSPFFAINGWLREEVNYGGSLTAQAGWQWRGFGSGHLLRVGAQYFLGRSVAFQFFRQYEKLIGVGIWYDY